MTAEPDLLPLPEWTKRDDAGQNMVPSEIRVSMAAYASANVAHATAAKDAEIEALRAEVERAVEVAQAGARLVEKAARQRNAAETRAERLAEALRPLAGLAREIVPALEATGFNVSLAADVKQAADAARAALDQETTNG